MGHLRSKLVCGLTVILALILGVTGMIPAAGFGISARAEEEMEIVGSYPYTTVTKDSVNLRARKSTSSELLKKIPKGAEISVKSVSGSWAAVDYGKLSGYVRTDYIVLKKVQKIRVTPTPTPVPTLSPEEDAGGYIILRSGMSGSEVRALQEALIELGFLKGKADGVFGSGTEQAVIAFQRANSYPDTGLVDANLQAFLYSGSPKNSKGTATKIKTLSPAAGVTMKSGNTGEAVGLLQTRLKELGYYDGVISNTYDAATVAAVKAFQKKNSLKADGIAGAETQKAIYSDASLSPNETATPTPSPTPTPKPTYTVPTATVKYGTEGADAKTVQLRLKELGFYKGRADGIFGRASVNALKEFQAYNNLTIDGAAGKSTYKILFSDNVISLVATPSPTPSPTPAITPTPVPAPVTAAITWDTMRSGDKGTGVSQLQEALINAGYLAGKADGTYGADTESAVRAFQKANGLTADGVAGKATQQKLFGAGAVTVAPTATPKAGTATAAPTSSTLREGDSGAAVKAMQQKLISLGYLSGRADGVFGSKTAEAVRAFQKASRLSSDGVAGSKTLTALDSAGTASAVKTNAAPASVSTSAYAALSGKPSAGKVIYANWYTTVKSVARSYPYATVYDFQTGISWQIHIFSLGAHADYEPLTANDTSKMLKVFGGNTWNPRPVWVIFADGSVYIGSTHSNPHGTQHTKDNNFDGHSCLHFPRTQEQVVAIGPYATSHQEEIDKGWAKTQAMK